ncbi:AbrB/MazE/SpoVT family DNA-binding domain-containing protein [Vagococcus elongatus]|uniref:SpoVT-AbrB domain-containing protein n=1 Tax=Vagococcus elongatus TaxID=180344 RepID=A0A430ANJ7_9ENTE|nr:AbrB/MazE/SpoVT family DNA-binding domain-containing protein [Vagococcus elongatus]RSU09681.1 hypothetical protein CBF29_10910 [Vagococcus elongatus]
MMKTEDAKLTGYKVRRSGNSDVVTIPSKVKEILDIEEGDTVAFVVENSVVKIVKKEPKIDIEALIDDSINQYHELLEDLVDM